MSKISNFTNIRILFGLLFFYPPSEVLSQVNLLDYNQSLRVDFYLGGNAHKTSLYLEQYKKEPSWSGSNKQLIYPEYGNFRIELLDFQTRKLLFSKGFNSLLSEWQHTEKAFSEKKLFYHAIQVPFPTKSVLIRIEERTREGSFEILYTDIVSPDSFHIKKEIPSQQHIKILLNNGLPSQKLDLAIVAEGYTNSEKEKFFKDAQRMVDYLFSVPPFSKHLKNFNIYAVASLSEESGTDIPDEKIFKKTIFDSSFYTFDMPRYLTASNIKAVADVAASVPYDHIYVLVNTDRYGGGGFYNHMSLVSADDPLSEIVFVHELGHGLVGLADEYYDSSTTFSAMYDPLVEPWEPNITTLAKFDSKWKKLIHKNTPIPTPRTDKYKNTLGVFEGGGYSSKGIYSPMQHCRMKDNKTTYFCKACSNAIENSILFYTK
ncbi:MAG: M64 family metallopeptidase [Capnocytophaga sp.]|nr:M64 family metallopeptidase [Capnocytophaga sp.]